MPSKADQIVVEIRKALAAIGSPALHVREDVLDLTAAREGDVGLIVVDLDKDPLTAATRRWHLQVLVAFRAKTVSPTSSTSSYAGIFATADAILAALIAAPALTAGGATGVEQLRRGKLTVWYQLGAQPGQPGGGLLSVFVDYVE